MVSAEGSWSSIRSSAAMKSVKPEWMESKAPDWMYIAMMRLQAAALSAN